MSFFIEDLNKLGISNEFLNEKIIATLEKVIDRDFIVNCAIKYYEKEFERLMKKAIRKVYTDNDLQDKIFRMTHEIVSNKLNKLLAESKNDKISNIDLDGDNSEF